MICRGCGKKLKKGEIVCTTCHYDNEGIEESIEEDALDHLEYFKDPYLEDVEDDSEEILDEEETDSDLEEYEFTDEDFDYYVSLYIGEDYKLIVEKPINIYALLLSYMYQP